MSDKSFFAGSFLRRAFFSRIFVSRDHDGLTKLWRHKPIPAEGQFGTFYHGGPVDPLLVITDAAVRKDQPKPKARRGPKPCLDWMKYGDWGPVWKRLRNTKRQEVSDPWLAKFEGMVRGWRAREKDVARPRITRSKASRDTWELAFPIMRSHARGRARTAGLMLSDPWKRKFETMSRNWRRKHLHRSREKHESV